MLTANPTLSWVYLPFHCPAKPALTCLYLALVALEWQGQLSSVLTLRADSPFPLLSGPVLLCYSGEVQDLLISEGQGQLYTALGHTYGPVASPTIDIHPHVLY